MAIKISNTTVISDARNVENVNVITANTFVGDGSQLTGIPVPPEVATPTNVSPADEATDIEETPTLEGSAFLSLYGKTKSAAQWQISTVSDFASTVLNTGDVAGTGLTFTVSAGVLSVSTLYYWRVRYKNSDGAYSEFSTPTEFTTMASFSFGPTTLGESFEGGFYTGVIDVAGTCYYVLVAPNATGCASCQWKTTRTTTAGTTSCVNGYTNTYGPLDNATHPAGNWTATRTISGFSDWYLPAKDELNLMYTNKGSMPGGEGFAAANYWSSTEDTANDACSQTFLTGSICDTTKTTSLRVRAVRRFPV